MDNSPEGSENSRKENIPVSASPPSIEDDDALLNDDDEDVGIQNPDDVQIPEDELLRIDDEMEEILDPPIQNPPDNLDANEFDEERRILEEEMPEGRESEDRQGEDERMDTEEPESPPADAIRARDSTSAESMEEDADDEDEEESEEDAEQADQNVANVSLTAPVPLTQIDKSIHIGTEHQAQISNEGTPEPVAREEEIGDDQRETLIWDCEQRVDKKRLVDYIGETSGKFSMPIDRALYILRKENLDFDSATKECGKRKEIKDTWTEEEVALFTTSYFNFGKKFRKIKAVMPNRSLHSIVNYYYQTKKVANYKTNIGIQLNETDKYDELMNDINRMERVEAGYCENCNQKSSVLILNKMMSRHECRPCILYFRLMRTSRPPSLLTTGEKQNKRVVCPEYMKPFVNDYVELMSPADGKAAERLGIPEFTITIDDDDDECVVLDECEIRVPSKELIVEGLTEDDDPIDSNTCHMTRIFDSPAALAFIDSLRKKHQKAVPLVWRIRQTKCMEEISLINEAARQEVMKTMATEDRINLRFVARWRQEMGGLKGRHSKWISEADIAAACSTTTISRSGRVRYDANWTDDEKTQCIRCFHWHQDDFESIANVILTKTVDQIKAFYKEHEEVLSKSLKSYREVMQSRRNRIDGNIRN